MSSPISYPLLRSPVIRTSAATALAISCAAAGWWALEAARTRSALAPFGPANTEFPSTLGGLALLFSFWAVLEGAALLERRGRSGGWALLPWLPVLAIGVTLNLAPARPFHEFTRLYDVRHPLSLEGTAYVRMERLGKNKPAPIAYFQEKSTGAVYFLGCTLGAQGCGELRSQLSQQLAGKSAVRLEGASLHWAPLRGAFAVELRQLDSAIVRATLGR